MAPFIQRTCPICRSAGAEPFLEKSQLRLVRCTVCGMIYANPVPAEMGGEFYDKLGQPFYLSPEKLQSDYSSVRFERELRLFQTFCRPGNVLDVGCSTGAFLFHLKSKGDYRTSGVEISGYAAEYARSRGVTVLEEPFLKHDFGGERFDAITFWAVMEHLLEPKEFLARAAGLLKKKGHCFILVPNMKSLAVRLLGRKYRYIFPQHINYFTPDTLLRFARGAALEVVARGSMHFNPIVIWQDFRGAGEFVPDQERAALLKRTTAYKKNSALKPARLVYRAAEKLLASVDLADNLFIVLRKA